MSSASHIIIPLKGLGQGSHCFDFVLGSDFFETFGNQEIGYPRLKVHVVLEKQASMLRLDLSITGSLVQPCDRCLGDVVLPIAYRAPLMVKFGLVPEEEAESEELMVLAPQEVEIDLSQYLYDSICLSLPLQVLHPEGGCDPEMKKKLDELIIK